MFKRSNRLGIGRSFVTAGAAVIGVLALAVPVSADKIRHPIAVFTGLDKITGRTIAFQAAAGETVQFGTLQITERVCYTRPATEAPQTTSFVQVDEIDANNKYKRIFSGWMFASSPGLHGIEHPVYDIWLTDCQGGGPPEEKNKAAEVPASAPESPEVNTQEPPAQAVPPVPQPHRKGRKKRPPAAAAEEPMGEPPPPPQEQDIGAPPLGAPVEVGPPPGAIPAPRGNQLPPPQQFNPY